MHSSDGYTDARYNKLHGIDEWDRLQKQDDSKYDFKVEWEFKPTSSHSGHYAPVVYKRLKDDPEGEWKKDESKGVSFAAEILKGRHQKN